MVAIVSVPFSWASMRRFVRGYPTQVFRLRPREVFRLKRPCDVIGLGSAGRLTGAHRPADAEA